MVGAGLYLDTVAPIVTAVILKPWITIRQTTLEHAVSGLVFSIFIDDMALVLRENGEISVVDARAVEVAKAGIGNPYTEEKGIIHDDKVFDVIGFGAAGGVVGDARWPSLGNLVQPLRLWRLGRQSGWVEYWLPVAMRRG